MSEQTKSSFTIFKVDKLNGIYAEPGYVLVMLMIKEGILGFVPIPSSYKNGDQVELYDGRKFTLAGHRANVVGYNPVTPSKIATGSNTGGY